MEKFWGKMTSIDLKDCDLNRITSKGYIGDYVIQLCKLIDMNRFGDTQIVHFGQDEKVAGFSFVQFIETSLISGHFANASKSAYIDIFSCKDYDHTAASTFTTEYFGSQCCKMSVLMRE